ncbi:helix-turn-helix domain-containing protein [Streptococcus infantis]|uniref:helix-turn-helix domain-containing protein n=1 Tax=Streptococcus infantis TaxID=68892 RepID=UPI0039C3695F
MDDFGKTLRFIRTSKQVSINKLADDVISKSQLSRFERGESEISCSKLNHLLNKLNTSFDEFLIINRGFSDDDFKIMINEIRDSTASSDIQNLIKILESYQSKDKSTLKNFEITLLKSILNNYSKDIYPSKSELDELVDYLFEVEHWGYYEISLFGNCFRQLTYQTIFSLTKELLNKIRYYIRAESNKRLVIQLTINCLIVSIDKEYFENARYLLKKVECLLNSETTFYEKTVFIYASGYLLYKEGNLDGKNKMLDALKVLKILSEDKFYKNYIEHYNKIVN